MNRRRITSILAAMALCCAAVLVPQAAQAASAAGAATSGVAGVCGVESTIKPTTVNGKKAIAFRGRVGCTTASGITVRVCAQVLGLDYYGKATVTGPTKCAGPGSVALATGTVSCSTMSGSFSMFTRTNYTVSSGGMGGGTTDSGSVGYKSFCG